MANRKGVSAVTILVAASGWIVSLFLGVLELPTKVNSFFEDGPKAKQNVVNWLLLDETFTGIWTSDLEGWVDATEDERRASLAAGGPVTLRVRVYNGSAEGEIRTEGLANTYVYPVVLLEGEKRDGGIDLVAYDYVGGKKTALAQLRLDLGEGGLPLRLAAVKQAGPFFPHEANLYRTSIDVSEALAGGVSVDLMPRFSKQGE